MKKIYFLLSIAILLTAANRTYATDYLNLVITNNTGAAITLTDFFDTCAYEQTVTSCGALWDCNDGTVVPAGAQSMYICHIEVDDDTFDTGTVATLNWQTNLGTETSSCAALDPEFGPVSDNGCDNVSSYSWSKPASAVYQWTVTYN